jgi:hypothetical protein
LFEDGSWHHFAVVFTTDTTVAANNTVDIYIDGVLNQGSLTQFGNPYGTGTNGVDFSGRYGGTEPTDGLLDEIRIYNRALTAVEVTALYNQSR